MRPERLELTAFGPYLKTQHIDFERLGEHGLFLIHGRTGSGKSSLLDALCFALFGKSTGDERKGEDFVTTLDRGAETKVTLEFEHLGTRYRVTRSPSQSVTKRRGEGFTLRQTEASLVNLDSGEVIASKAGDVTAAVEEMLRCDVSQFRQTVVLPQGDFRRVVTEHRARREILASIFSTQRFAEVSARLADSAKQLAQQGQGLQEQRGRLLEDQGVGNVVELERLASEAMSAVENRLSAKQQASKVKDVALTAEAAGKALADDFEELTTERELSVELERVKSAVDEMRLVAGRADRAARLLGQWRELEGRRTELAGLAQEGEESRRALSDAETELAARRQERADLDQQRPELEASETLKQRLSVLKPRVDGMAEKLERRQKLLEERGRVESDLNGARSRLTDLDAASDQLAEEQGKLRRKVDSELEVSGLLARAEEDLRQHGVLTALQADIAALDAEIDEHRGRFQPLALLNEAVSANAPGLLAKELDEGRPCPVCGSVHHPSPSEHGDVEALTQAFQSFGDAAAASAELDARRAGLQRDVGKLLDERDWRDVLPPHDELAARAAAARIGVAQVTAARTRLTEIDGVLARLKDEREAAHGNAEQMASRLTELNRQLDGLDGEVKGAQEGLEPEQRDPAAFAEALATATARSEELRGRFDDAAASLSAAEQALDKARYAVTSVAGRLQTASERLNGLAEAFDEKLRAAGFEDSEDFIDAVMADEELDELQQQVRGHDEAVKLNAATVARLSRKLEGQAAPDQAALAEAVELARDQEVEADRALTEATTVFDRLKGALGSFRELERQDADVADRRRAAQKLSDLANGNLKGRAKINFETFVLRSIFARVLQEANHHLKNMTGGRYTMLLVDDPGGRDTGLELNVRDNQSGGETRPIHTLSGGEGFLASLSLALGLSEISQRESGGVELGALFIDEGFGSLDTQSLDQVIDILRGLEQGKRMVGIISHVEDLKRRVPVQLLVVGDGVGSRVEMRLNA